MASLLVRQLLDNTMFSAGLIQDPKNYVTRVSKLMTHILNTSFAHGSGSEYKVEAAREEIPEEIDSILKEMKKEEEKGEGKPSEFDSEIVIDKDGNPQVKKK